MGVLSRIVEEVINETSRRQKLTKKFQGLDKNLYNLGIITSENPMGNKLSKEDNKSRLDDIDDFLRQGGYLYYRVKGKYGNVEHPCIVFNISLDTLKEIGYKFQQESFIYGEFIPQNNGGTKLLFQYFEKGEKTPYRLKDKNLGYVKFEKDVKDYFTAISKDFKFNIPFSIFESTLYECNKLLSERSENLKYVNRKCSLIRESMDMDKTEQHRRTCRFKLYGQNYEKWL